MLETTKQPVPSTAELERIQIEYERRKREIPADRYSWIRPVNRLSHSQVWRAAITALAGQGKFPFNDLSALDIGCGMGSWLVEFVQWGASPDRVAGIDLMPYRTAEARRSLPQSDIRTGDASQLPWEDATFDVVSQFGVFTSVLDSEMRRRMAAEMLRVVKPDGVILWYDFAYDNPQNANVRGMKAREVRDLFAGCQISLERITLAPPIARRVVPVSWILALMLEKLPFLRTHLLGTIRK